MLASTKNESREFVLCSFASWISCHSIDPVSLSVKTMNHCMHNMTKTLKQKAANIVTNEVCKLRVLLTSRMKGTAVDSTGGVRLPTTSVQ